MDYDDYYSSDHNNNDRKQMKSEATAIYGSQKEQGTIYFSYEEDKSMYSSACYHYTHSRCKGKGKCKRTGMVCACPCHMQQDNQKPNQDNM